MFTGDHIFIIRVFFLFQFCYYFLFYYCMNGFDDFFLLYKLSIHRSEVIARTGLVLTPKQYTRNLPEFIFYPILALASNIRVKK